MSDDDKPSIEDLVTDEKLQKTIEGLKEEIPDVDPDEVVTTDELNLGDTVSQEVAEQIKHLADPEACDDDACSNLREQFGIVAEGDDHDHDDDEEEEAEESEESDEEEEKDGDGGNEQSSTSPEESEDESGEDEDSGEWHGWS